MKKPFAYITAVWKGGEFSAADQTIVYCRKVYEAGFTPISFGILSPPSIRTALTWPVNFCAGAMS